MIRPTLVLVTLLGLAACAAPPRLHGAAAQDAACAQRADDAYLRQNRAEIYRADAYATSGRDTPFTGAGYLNAPSLSDRYAREQMLDNCLAGRGGVAGPTDAPNPAAEAVPHTAPPPPKP